MRISRESDRGFLVVCAMLFIALVFVFSAGMLVNRGPSVYERIVVQTVDVPIVVYQDRVIIATIESKTIIENVKIVTPYGFPASPPTFVPTFTPIATSETVRYP